jgi:NodT family efflux transporter outer membrane factor (OMF) lipoprotein
MPMQILSGIDTDSASSPSAHSEDFTGTECQDGSMFLTMDGINSMRTAWGVSPQGIPARILITLCLGWLLFSTGCKVGPDFRRPAVALPTDWEAVPQCISPEEQEVLCCWWKQLNDPELDIMIEHVVTSNLSLQEALQRIEEARAIERVTAALSRPDAFATGLSQNRQFSKTGNAFIPQATAFQLYSLGFDTSWEIDLWGKLKRLKYAAIADRNAITEAYFDLVISLCAETAKTLVEARTLQTRLAIAERNLSVQSDTVKLAEAKQQAGLVTYLDVAQGISEYHTTESTVPFLRQQLQQAALRLCVLQGYMPTLQQVEPLSVGPIPDVPESLYFGMPQDLLRRRPDIRKAEQDMIRECERIGVATADLYPQLSLTGIISVDSRNVDTLFNPNSIADTLGPSFRWNILSLGRVRNKIAAQDAKFNQTVANYQETVLLAAEEALGSMVAVHEERQRLYALSRATLAGQQAVDLAKEQYGAGLVAFQAVLESQRQLLRSEEAMASSQGQVILNVIRTYKAVGGGWQCPTDPIVSDSPTEIASVEGSMVTR